MKKAIIIICLSLITVSVALCSSSTNNLNDSENIDATGNIAGNVTTTTCKYVLIKQSQFNPDGIIDSYFTYEYDNQGNMIKTSGFLSDGTIVNYFIHESSYVDDGAEIGAGTNIWHFSHILSGSRIGENCNIGQNVVIGPDVVIGNGCKIQNNVSVFKGVTLEDGVFCGPSMVFTNVYNPRAEIRKMDQVRSTLVMKGATIGANATIVCGTTVGKYSFIGAGAIVTKNVPDYALVVGNPARQISWVCECGERLPDDLRCLSCGKKFEEKADGIGSCR